MRGNNEEITTRKPGKRCVFIACGKLRKAEVDGNIDVSSSMQKKSKISRWHRLIDPKTNNLKNVLSILTE